MTRFYEKHSLQPFVQLNTEVKRADWDSETGLWTVELQRKDGTTFKDECNVLINGSGVLTKWKWPDIEGLHDFEGTLAHSANWPRDLDWSGKRVAVIGTGSSSIQMLPHLAETAEHVTVFMRNQTYIAPQFGANVMNTDADPEAKDPAAAGHHSYTEKEKQRFRDDPEYHLRYVERIEKAIVGGWDMFYRGSELNQLVTKTMQESMRARLGDRDDLKDFFIPAWSPGCRRLTPGEGYLEALIRPNVTAVHDDPIARVTCTGITTTSGTAHTFDIIACATGFSVQYNPHFPIRGTASALMQSTPTPEIYASVSAPHFPNYFVINGPRGNWGQGCALPSHETQILYVLQCCRKMQADRIKSMAPSPRITSQLNAYMDAWHKKHSIWSEDCKSWYKDQTTDGRVHIWPGSLLHHLKFLKVPRYEHYEIDYVDDENVFAFLGDGRTLGQVKYGKDAPVPYIRNDEDAEWDIE
jgi:cation diffusion facilitator CzcD-associated flavoprotein CzcO